MKAGLFIDGQWVDSHNHFPILDKYSGEVIETLPIAAPTQIERAITSAARCTGIMAKLPAHRRADILHRTADRLRADRELIARLIASEAGKPIRMARIEVDRAACTFQFAAEEAKRIHGQTIPFDASPNGEGFIGFWNRRPVGVVVAITPFNFPLNLVAHKVAPAIAAGNAFLLKPAEQTPLTAIRLFELLLESGLPPEAGQLIHGPGELVGEPLVRDHRVHKISFTGSESVGRRIVQQAGIKRVTLELGNNSPVIVADDADLDWAAKRCAVGAFSQSGQVCISVQRIYVDAAIEEAFRQKLLHATQAIVVGDPSDESTEVGPMISESEAIRIESWVSEAEQDGARRLVGGERNGSLYWPTILENTRPNMKVVCREVFAPMASLAPCRNFSEALEQADRTEFGLQAAVFTRDLDRVIESIGRLNFGGVIVNEMPGFRVDHMPYGGNRNSGIGREGVRFAIEEMTQMQTVAIRVGS